MQINQIRNTLRIVLLLAAFALPPAVTSYAQGNATADPPTFPHKGLFEVGGSVSYQRTTLIAGDQTDQTYTLFSFLPSVGYFPLDDAWEIGLNPPGIQVYTDAEQKITTVLVLASVAYNVRLSGIWTPFAEVQLGYSSETLGGSLADLNTGDTMRVVFCGGGRGGVKFEVVRHCLVNAGAQYQRITLGTTGGAVLNRSDNLLFSLGLSFWF